MSNSILGSKFTRTFAPALLGFLGYGGWGFFCNFMYGFNMGLQSGLVQGSLSFTITLVSNVVMETLYRITRKKWPTVVATATMFIGTSYSVNTLAGTPEVLWTIAPGAIFGTIYAVSYVSALQKLSAKTTNL